MYTYNGDGELLENGMWIDYADVADILNRLEEELLMLKIRNKHLETKLAESNEAIKYLKGIKRYDIGEMLTENAKLKQQLAEKEAERHEEWKTSKEWKWEWQKVSRQLEQANQAKILFAVERLEKVKEHISSGLAFDIDVQMWFEEYIDNQIKQLKEY